MRGFKNIKIILSIIAFTVMFGAYGQNNATIDSLKTVLKTAKEDTAKVNSLNALSKLYNQISDHDISRQYAESALELADTLDYKKGIAHSYNNIGISFYGVSDYAKALGNYLKAIEILEEIGDKKGIGNSLINIGDIYFKQGNYPEALENYLASLKIFQEIGDKEGLGYSQKNIGMIYRHRDEYELALEYLFLSLKIFEEIEDKKGIANTYLEIGQVYQNQDKFQKAMDYSFASLKIFEEIEDKSGIGYSQKNIGLIYWRQRKNNKAIEHLQISLKISKEIGDENLTISNYTLLGWANSDLNKFRNAKKYLENGLVLAKKIGTNLQIMYCYLALSTLDEKEGNYRQALEDYRNFNKYQNNIYNEKNNQQTALMRIKFDTEQKEREIELLNKDKELQAQVLQRQRILKNGLFAGVLLVVLIGFLTFRSFRLRKKLEKQQAIVEERHRISADLHDDVGSGLSKITLLSELLKTQAKTPENRKEAEKISETALELSSTISEIIWALNSNNDYLENMIAYIRRYAAEYFEESPVKLKVVTQGEILPTPINGEHRRNIFYTVKEALNNIMKHAQATEAELKFVVIDDKLDVIISDNGKGLPDGDLNRFGNGINNMRERMKSISGDFKIESHHGTRIILNLAI